MHVATIRQQGSEEIIVWGLVAGGDLRELLACGKEILAGECDTVVLDLRSATFDSSEFVGAVAELAMEARARSKTFALRAAGRAADWQAWSGLQNIARLEVFSGSEVPVGQPCQGFEGDDLP
ncbi:MAG: hypothetical protein ACYTKD_31045 [Planctomycetota bacterium]|jgi:hypothetical protein